MSPMAERQVAQAQAVFGIGTGLRGAGPGRRATGRANGLGEAAGRAAAARPFVSLRFKPVCACPSAAAQTPGPGQDHLAWAARAGGC